MSKTILLLPNFVFSKMSHETDLISLFPLPLNKYEHKIFKKLSTVKEEVEMAKYSELIICP